MRPIRKGQPPNSLIAHRQAKDASYENYRDKDDLRGCLTSEQRSICCYCMGRIHASADGMKTEHCLSQKQFPEQQLSYANLLGACKGNEGAPHRLQHCDTFKGESSFSFNPADSGNHSRLLHQIRFLSDGTITADNESLDRELNEVLNLNVERLKEARRLALDGFLPPHEPSVSYRPPVSRDG